MEMDDSVIVPINSLQTDQKNVRIKVMVLRQGIQNSTRQGSTTIRKMIFMDEEGTMIHGIMFSNIIQLFQDQFKINETYIIEDPIVQPINKKYPNVNKNIELLLHRGTKIIESQPQLTCHNLNFDFKEFAYVNANPATDNEHDVIGILMKVRQLTRFERKDKLSFGYRREVIMINTMLQTITINLWDDLALNEGQLLEDNRIQNSIVAFCNLKMSIYHGFPQLQSTFTTGMLQKPECSETEKINLWLENIVGKQSLNTLWVEKTIKECEEIKLEQLMDKNISFKQDIYYCFKATIREIENKSKPWYEACSSCLKAIIKTTSGINCANCTKQPVEVMQRYRLIITVQDNDTSARLTLFEDVASDFIGCSVNEYMELLNKELDETKFPIALHNSINEEHVFLFKMDQELIKQKKALSIVVEGFRRPLLDIFDTKKSRKQKISTSFQDRKGKKKRYSPKTTTKQDDAHVSKQATDGIIEIKDDEKIVAFAQRRRRVMNQGKEAKAKAISVKKEKN